jgi:glycosyltransferase involved in cell wall biosynthesis
MSVSQLSGSVWYISKYFAPPRDTAFGGRGASLMRELASQGYDVTVITSDANHLSDTPVVTGRYLDERQDGYEICWVKTLKYGSALSARRVLSWFHFEWGVLRIPRRRYPAPDVVIASSLSLLSVVSGVVLSRRYQARLVFEVRDIWPLTLTTDGDFSRWNPLVFALGLVERFGYRRADAIVGTMPNLGAHVENVLGEKRVVHCIPMGYDEGTAHASVDIPDRYREAIVPSGKFLVGYAGTIGITNAVGDLLQSARLLIDDPRIHFVIVGDGGLRLQYERMYGAMPNVTFVGAVPRNSVQAVLAQFDVVAFCTNSAEIWEFGHSLNKVVDYMLSGKPIIASYTGFDDMIGLAHSGVIVPAGDSAALAHGIVQLLEIGPGRRADMGKRGRAWILENRAYKTLAEEYAAILFPTET